MPPEVQSSSVALNPSNNPDLKQGYLEAAPYGINAPFAWEFKAVMEMVSLLLIWNTDGY